ncbi:MAG TPA: YCF48-related protein [Candidatus Eisenbacteria bacterium]|nr:YCF48-related protein [Candidatus Eisenbacteria bacterium]
MRSTRAWGAIALLLVAGCARQGTRQLWEATAIPTDAQFDGMWFTDSLNGWITGGGYAIDGGIVGRTRDGGRTWSFQSGVLSGGGARFSMGGVQFLDSLRGVSVGYGGIVLVTSDGGANWRPVRYGRSGGDGLSDVQFIDSRNGWAVGPASVVRTQDGGETWSLLVTNKSENGYLSGNAIHFVDLWNGWMVGHGGALYRSSDGGVNWTRVPVPLGRDEHPTFWDVTFTDASHGWVVGERGTILHTEDGGVTWVRQQSGVPIVRVLPSSESPRHDVVPELETEPDRLSISAVQFADDKNGYAVGYYADVAESVVLSTSDGGATWRVERVVPGELLRSLFLLDAQHAWAAGDRARTAPQVVLRRLSGGASSSG